MSNYSCACAEMILPSWFVGLLEKPVPGESGEDSLHGSTQQARVPSLLYDTVPMCTRNRARADLTTQTWMRCAPSSRDGGLFLRQLSPSPAAVPIGKEKCVLGKEQNVFLSRWL